MLCAVIDMPSEAVLARVPECFHGKVLTHVQCRGEVISKIRLSKSNKQKLRILLVGDSQKRGFLGQLFDDVATMPPGQGALIRINEHVFPLSIGLQRCANDATLEQFGLHWADATVEDVSFRLLEANAFNMQLLHDDALVVFFPPQQEEKALDSYLEQAVVKARWAATVEIFKTELREIQKQQSLDDAYMTLKSSLQHAQSYCEAQNDLIAGLRAKIKQLEAENGRKCPQCMAANRGITDKVASQEWLQNRNLQAQLDLTRQALRESESSEKRLLDELKTKEQRIQQLEVELMLSEAAKNELEFQNAENAPGEIEETAEPANCAVSCEKMEPLKPKTQKFISQPQILVQDNNETHALELGDVLDLLRHEKCHYSACDLGRLIQREMEQKDNNSLICAAFGIMRGGVLIHVDNDAVVMPDGVQLLLGNAYQIDIQFLVEVANSMQLQTYYYTDDAIFALSLRTNARTRLAPFLFSCVFQALLSGIALTFQHLTLVAIYHESAFYGVDALQYDLEFDAFQYVVSGQPKVGRWVDDKITISDQLLGQTEVVYQAQADEILYAVGQRYLFAYSRRHQQGYLFDAEHDSSQPTAD